MSGNFPTTFAETVQPIEDSIGQRGDAALENLRAKGYTIATGLTVPHATAVGMMGQQPHIVEYCPRDASPSRFITEQTTREWLKKGGGRAMFLLLSQVLGKDGQDVGQRLEGYGWTGFEECDELPDHPITSAYRLGATALGKKLSVDFTQVIVSGTNALFAPNEGIGLETWQSNHARGVYEKAGFELVATAKETERRPTLKKTKDGKIRDRRMYMAYPQDLLVS